MPRPRSPRVRVPAKPRAPRAPKALTTRPTQPITPRPVTPSSPAPRTATGEAIRIGAQEQYQIGTTKLNEELYRAALRYGDPTTLGQLRSFGPVVENPNSALSKIRRSEQLGLRNVEQGENRNNTFFSSLRLGNQQHVTDQASRERLSAQERYQEAYRKWTTGSHEALARLQEILRQAEAGEIEKALGEAPGPTGVLPPTPHPTSIQPGATHSVRATGRTVSTRAMPKIKVKAKSSGGSLRSIKPPTRSPRPKKSVRKKK